MSPRSRRIDGSSRASEAGLNLGVSQLSGELRRAGHESLIVYFKDFLAVPVDQADRYIVSDYPGILVGARGHEMVWNCYKPFSDTEYRLLIEALREFRADLIGLSLSSLTIKQAGGRGHGTPEGGAGCAGGVGRLGTDPRARPVHQGHRPGVRGRGRAGHRRPRGGGQLDSRSPFRSDAPVASARPVAGRRRDR